MPGPAAFTTRRALRAAAAAGLWEGGRRRRSVGWGAGGGGGAAVIEGLTRPNTRPLAVCPKCTCEHSPHPPAGLPRRPECLLIRCGVLPHGGMRGGAALPHGGDAYSKRLRTDSALHHVPFAGVDRMD